MDNIMMIMYTHNSNNNRGAGLLEAPLLQVGRQAPQADCSLCYLLMVCHYCCCLLCCAVFVLCIAYLFVYHLRQTMWRRPCTPSPPPSASRMAAP